MRSAISTSPRSFSAVLSLVALSAVAVAACKGPPAELEPPEKEPATTAKPLATPPPSTAAAVVQKEGKGAHADDTIPPNADGKGDPLQGKFTLADATKDLKGNGALVATIETSKGTIQCGLLDEKAPITVANFIGLATGKRSWKDPRTGQWVNKPAYDGTGFHRIIKGFMIQGGDPKGDGSGEPGYIIKDELWEGAHHDKAGLLCMANRGPNTNGAQFFITDAAAAHLDTSYTIFGECGPLQVVHDIAGVAVGPRDKPQSPVTIKSVTISRDEKKKKK